MLRAGSLHLDQVLANRYRIVQLLGHGGMGEVYEAHDTVLDLRVALKTMRGEVDETVAHRFQKEVVLSREIAHANVCRVYDLGLDETAGAFYTMELLRGRTLAEILKVRGTLPIGEASEIVMPVLAALAAAHAHGILHRDLKPANIVITDEGRVVVADFGLAVAFDNREAAEAGGTVCYMAPEQITGGSQSPATDLYSLGGVMYEMVAGRAPCEDSATEPAGVDPLWDAVILKCLQPSALHRYQSAAELRSALEKRVPLPRNGLMWAFGLACVAILLAGFFFARAPRSFVPAPDALSSYNRGLASLHDGDYNNAAKQFQRTIDIDPEFAMSHARLAEAFAEQDYSDKARESILKAISIAGTHHIGDRLDNLRLLAIQLTVIRSFSEAVDRYRKIAEIRKDADTLFDLARALERDAATDESVAIYRQTVAAQDSYPAAWARLGALLARKADFIGADEAFRKAESLYTRAGNLSGVAEVQLRRAVALMSQDRTADASGVLASAMKLAETTGFESQRIRILMRRGVLARLQEHEEEAEKYAWEALRLSGENRMEDSSMQGLLDLGNVYLQKRDLVGSEKYFAEALRIARTQNSRFHEARALASIASIRSQQGRFPEALTGAEKALVFFRAAGYRNELSNVLVLMAQIRSEAGDAQGALTAFEEQLATVPSSNGRALAAAHLRIGIALLQLARLPEAVVHLNGALTSSESITRAYATLNKARIEVMTGRYAEAHGLLSDEKLLSEPSGVVRIRAMGVRARAALQQARYAEAIREAESGIKRAGMFNTGEIEATLAEALSLAGLRRRSSALCDQLTKGDRDVRLAAGNLLSCAAADLAAGKFGSALERAQKARSLFRSLGQPEGEWRACTTQQLAGQLAVASECESLRKIVAERWGEKLWSGYTGRTDIRDRLSRLRRLP